MKGAIGPAELASTLNEGSGVQIIDVRLTEDREPVRHEIPGAVWRDPIKVDAWAGEFDSGRPVVVFCVHGLHVSQEARQAPAEKGFEVSILEGGIDAWQEYAESSPAGGR